MARRRPAYLAHLEQLEDRTVPTVLASFPSAGSLTLTGEPVGVLLVQLTGTNQVTVTDNGAPVKRANQPGDTGVYSLTGSLFLNLTRQTNSTPDQADVQIDLNDRIVPGNVQVNLGLGYLGSLSPGDYSVDVFDSSPGGPVGRISGNLTFVGGNGQETYNIGAFRTGTYGDTVAPISVLGALSVTGVRTSTGTGDLLRVEAGTTIGGTVTATYIDQISIGSTGTGDPLTTLSRDLNINNVNVPIGLRAVITGRILGNVTVNGTAVDDTFALQQIGTVGSGSILGSLSVTLGQGSFNGDQFLLGTGTLVGTNALLAASGNLNTLTGDQFRIHGNVNGNLNVTMGNNLNSLFFGPENFSDPLPYVGGDFRIIGGNGVNNIGSYYGVFYPATGPFTGNLGGNLFFTLGSGNNGSSLDPIMIAANLNPGKKIVWRSGNGDNFVQLGDWSFTLTDRNYNVDMIFGSGDDTVVADLGSGILSGSIDLGGRNLANLFYFLSGTPAPYPYLQIKNNY